jgi:hypothetical protein
MKRTAASDWQLLLIPWFVFLLEASTGNLNTIKFSWWIEICSFVYLSIKKITPRDSQIVSYLQNYDTASFDESIERSNILGSVLVNVWLSTVGTQMSNVIHNEQVTCKKISFLHKKQFFLKLPTTVFLVCSVQCDGYRVM